MSLQCMLKELSQAGLHIFHGLGSIVSYHFPQEGSVDLLSPINNLEHLLKEVEQTPSSFNLKILLPSRG